jgi:hypothetical protein
MTPQISGRAQAMVSKGGKRGRGIPPRGKYVLEFVRVVDYKLGKPFEGEEPKMQFTLEFALVDYDDPETGEPLLIHNWYTNKWEHISGYQAPKLYKLVQAMNGGEPWPVERDQNGDIIEFNGWDELMTHFVGKRFIQRVACNENDWARMTGDPEEIEEEVEAPRVVRGTRRLAKAPSPTATMVDEETGEISEEEDGKF